LVKLGDLVINELVQAKEFVPLPIELEHFQLVGFELVRNHLTPGDIKATYVLVHHCHHLHVQDNNVAMNNDPNVMFKKALIDVYFLGVFNPKRLHPFIAT